MTRHPIPMDRHVRALRDLGFTILPAQLEPESVAALGALADRALEAVRAVIASGRRVPFQPETDHYEAASALYCWGAAALGLLEHPQVHALAGSLLSDYLLNDLTVFSVPPSGDPAMPVQTTSWHRDCPIDPGGGLPGHLWFFFALDDFTPENGATWVVPGSHRGDPPGAVNVAPPWRPLDRELYRDRRQLILQAGDLAVIDARILHSSDRNDTDRPRRLINLGLVHAGLRDRVRANHWRIAGPKITGRASPLVRRLLGDRWPDRPHVGPPPVLPPNWPTAEDRRVR